MPIGNVLTGAEISRLVAGERPLIRGAIDLARQIQPNGIDLTLDQVWRLTGGGQLGVDDADRRLPDREAIVPGDDGDYELAAGLYVASVTEVVELPDDVMALGRSRSSLLRCGVALNTAVWDAGYAGRSEVLMVVYNPFGFRVRQAARFLQLVFFRLSGPTEPYRGAYHLEHVRDTELDGRAHAPTRLDDRY